MDDCGFCCLCFCWVYAGLRSLVICFCLEIALDAFVGCFRCGYSMGFGLVCLWLLLVVYIVALVVWCLMPGVCGFNCVVAC